jgi:predicted CXXCH cytochrome family protein
MRFSQTTAIGKLPILAMLCALPALAPAVVRGQTSVVGSPHDLSVHGPTRIHALSEEQVCIFCHAPHNATGQAPLWNRHMPPTHYRIYTSPTTDARIDQPSGPSKMCLSCHDGALALGLVANRPANEPIVMSFRTIPPGRNDLTADLSDDHPIGFRYDRALFNRDGQLRNPDVVTPELPMGPHQEVHCTTCHDPHDNSLGNFLRMPDRRSAICLSCHDLSGWESSAHALSARAVRNRGVDRSQRLAHGTVADNACSSCHKVHSAPGRKWLLRDPREEQNCLNCHDGGTAASNIASEIRKPSGHPAQRYRGQHVPGEDPRSAPPHVECSDCHNPHATETAVARPIGRPSLGEISPTMRFVSGVDRNGRTIAQSRFEYEVCFKCHADNISRNVVRQTVPRFITQSNTRLQFQPTNPSFHPVIGPRRNPDVVSLRPPWRVGSVMRCTDCHNSDSVSAGGRGGVRGPHGSIHEPLLIDNYDTEDFTVESPQSYALCYRCHDRASILGDQSFPFHNSHIVRGRAPCSACHDAHGISRSQGNSSSNSSLINFDRTIVQPAGGGLGPRIEFVDTGQFSGSCTLTCHGVAHVRFQYNR